MPSDATMTCLRCGAAAAGAQPSERQHEHGAAIGTSKARQAGGEYVDVAEALMILVNFGRGITKTIPEPSKPAPRETKSTLHVPGTDSSAAVRACLLVVCNLLSLLMFSLPFGTVVYCHFFFNRLLGG
jgi:hypothetical protein